MDSTIWKALPEELLDQVLSLLPLQTLFNLRPTCKRIRSLILSPYFISNYSSSSSSSQPFFSFLLLSHPHFGSHRFAVYDSFLRRWRNFPLPLSAFLPFRTSSSFSLLASAKGLLCFSRPSSTSPSSSSSFLICNLLTRSTRVIKFPNYPLANHSITLVPTRSGYKIFTLCPGTSTSVFVYDSADRQWHQSESTTPNIKANYHRREGVICDGSLYFNTGEPYSIVGYDLETRRWDVLAGGIPGRDRMVFTRLVSDGEKKMYLIGGIATYWISSGVKVWELDGERNWVEIGSLPEEVCRKFVGVCYHNYEHVYCMWHRGMICLCCYTWPEILYYDVAAREWGWLPKCPLLPEKGSCGFTWFSVVPQLYTLV
ncbi:F-box/kelch-repeat protein At5g43190 [Linum grandiflorum]